MSRLILSTSMDARALALVTAIATLLVTGCGSTSQRIYDAVRIKESRQARYEETPGSRRLRDGRTLQGTVRELEITLTGDSSQKPASFIFLDGTVENEPENWERIRYDDIEPVAERVTLGPDSIHRNMNVVEIYNETRKPLGLRRVPVTYVDTDGHPAPPPHPPVPVDCNCTWFSPGVDLPTFRCPDRIYPWYFAEIRGVYGAFSDQIASGGEARTVVSRGAESFGGEVAAGVRFGARQEWGAGVLLGSGFVAANQIGDDETRHPLALAHLRYQTPWSIACMKPFMYAQAGIAVDPPTLNLVRYNLVSEEECECKKLVKKASESPGSITPGATPPNFDFPLTYGFGIGLDIPVTSSFDLSADIGYRSVGIAEQSTLGGLSAPMGRRVDMILFRVGITL